MLIYENIVEDARVKPLEAIWNSFQLLRQKMDYLEIKFLVIDTLQSSWLETKEQNITWLIMTLLWIDTVVPDRLISKNIK